MVNGMNNGSFVVVVVFVVCCCRLNRANFSRTTVRELRDIVASNANLSSNYSRRNEMNEKQAVSRRSKVCSTIFTAFFLCAPDVIVVVDKFPKIVCYNKSTSNKIFAWVN